MATEPTKEAIQEHQRRFLETALEVAEESLGMPPEFVNDLHAAIDLNAAGNVDEALEAAQTMQQDLQELTRALEDVADALKGIDEEPAPAPGKDGTR